MWGLCNLCSAYVQPCSYCNSCGAFVGTPVIANWIIMPAGHFVQQEEDLSHFSSDDNDGSEATCGSYEVPDAMAFVEAPVEMPPHAPFEAASDADPELACAIDAAMIAEAHAGAIDAAMPTEADAVVESPDASADVVAIAIAERAEDDALATIVDGDAEATAEAVVADLLREICDAVCRLAATASLEKVAASAPVAPRQRYHKKRKTVKRVVVQRVDEAKRREEAALLKSAIATSRTETSSEERSMLERAQRLEEAKAHAMHRFERIFGAERRRVKAYVLRVANARSDALGRCAIADLETLLPLMCLTFAHEEEETSPPWVNDRSFVAQDGCDRIIRELLDGTEYHSACRRVVALVRIHAILRESTAGYVDHVITALVNLMVATVVGISYTFDDVAVDYLYFGKAMEDSGDPFWQELFTSMHHVVAYGQAMAEQVFNGLLGPLEKLDYTVHTEAQAKGLMRVIARRALRQPQAVINKLCGTRIAAVIASIKS